MTLADRIGEFLQRLTPMTRGNLLTELERLELGDDEIPGSAEILAKLRAEVRKDGSNQTRVANPSRYFFAPLEPLLADGAHQYGNAGRGVADLNPVDRCCRHRADVTARQRHPPLLGG